MKHHVALCICHEHHTEDCGFIGEAATEAEAIAAAEAAGYTVLLPNNGGKIDFYDAEKGALVQEYEYDGRGLFVVTVSPKQGGAK